MTTITAYVTDDLNNALTSVAKLMERSKSFVISKAIENYVREQLEDFEDAEEALRRKNNPNRKFYTSEEMKQRLEARYHAEYNL